VRIISRWGRAEKSLVISMFFYRSFNRKMAGIEYNIIVKLITTGVVLMLIKICMGSACYFLGASKIAKRLQELIDETSLTDSIDFRASFCMGPCSEGVVVEVDGQRYYRLSPENVEEFFQREVLNRIENRNGE
jgi:NADH:ubiquinone oxidoreductase subunit E